MVTLPPATPKIEPDAESSVWTVGKSVKWGAGRVGVDTSVDAGEGIGAGMGVGLDEEGICGITWNSSNNSNTVNQVIITILHKQISSYILCGLTWS